MSLFLFRYYNKDEFFLENCFSLVRIYLYIYLFTFLFMYEFRRSRRVDIFRRLCWSLERCHLGVLDLITCFSADCWTDLWNGPRLKCTFHARKIVMVRCNRQ